MSGNRTFFKYSTVYLICSRNILPENSGLPGECGASISGEGPGTVAHGARWRDSSVKKLPQGRMRTP